MNVRSQPCLTVRKRQQNSRSGGAGVRYSSRVLVVGRQLASKWSAKCCLTSATGVRQRGDGSRQVRVVIVAVLVGESVAERRDTARRSTMAKQRVGQQEWKDPRMALWLSKLLSQIPASPHNGRPGGQDRVPPVLNTERGQKGTPSVPAFRRRVPFYN
jgi:hypothetical protein